MIVICFSFFTYSSLVYSLATFKAFSRPSVHLYDARQSEISSSAPNPERSFTSANFDSSVRLDVWMSMFSTGVIPSSEGKDLNISESNPSLWTSRLPSNLNVDKGLVPRLSMPAWTATRGNEPASPLPSLSEYLMYGRSLLRHHEEEVDKLWLVIKNTGSLRHLNETDRERVMEALRIAYVALYGKRTLKSLEISINRAKGIASVLGELNATVEVVLAGLLYEAFSDVSHDLGPKIRDQLLHKFGENVLYLIEKYGKLPKFMARTANYSSEQSESQVQMIVCLTEDYRTLYIRVAERLHTLRHLASLPDVDRDQEKIAEEGLNVYASLAHKMGLLEVKGELEDLAFQILSPHMYAKTCKIQAAASIVYQQVTQQIEDLLRRDPVILRDRVQVKFSQRIKGKYQIYLKMMRKNLSCLEDVRDLLGLRIIINVPWRRLEQETPEDHVLRSKSICYHLVEQLKKMKGWDSPTNGFKDYIAKPKDNGYRSIHVCLKHKKLGSFVEVQVRTMEMHVQAELGEAAHWFHKDSTYRPEIANSKTYKLAWRSPNQQYANSSAQLLKMAKDQLLPARVYVFQNDHSTVLNLRKGATALDAAFAIHSDMGLQTDLVRINGQKVGMNRPLKNGDVVHVEYKTGVVTAQLSWLQLVTTSNALSKLRRYFKVNQKDSCAEIGCSLLLATLGTSRERIQARLNGRLWTVDRILKMLAHRTPFKKKDELLLHLATAPKVEVCRTIATALNVSQEDVTVPRVGTVSAWIKSRKSSGWSEYGMEQELLNNLLPLRPESNLLVSPKIGGGCSGERCATSTPSSSSAQSEIRIPYRWGTAATTHAAPTARPHSRYVRQTSAFSLPRVAPFSLEASALSSSLRVEGRQAVASEALRQEKGQAEYVAKKNKVFVEEEEQGSSDMPWTKDTWVVRRERSRGLVGRGR